MCECVCCVCVSVCVVCECVCCVCVSVCVITKSGSFYRGKVLSKPFFQSGEIQDRCLGSHTSERVATRKYLLSQGNKPLIAFIHVASSKINCFPICGKQ